MSGEISAKQAARLAIEARSAFVFAKIREAAENGEREHVFINLDTDTVAHLKRLEYNVDQSGTRYKVWW